MAPPLAVNVKLGLLIVRLLPTSLCGYVPPLTVSVKLSASASPVTSPPLAIVLAPIVLPPSYTFVNTGSVIVSARFVIVYFASVATSNAYFAAIPAPYAGAATRLNAYSPASLPAARCSGLLVKNVVELALSPATNELPLLAATVYSYSLGSASPYTRVTVVGVTTSTRLAMVTVKACVARAPFLSVTL